MPEEIKVLAGFALVVLILTIAHRKAEDEARALITLLLFALVFFGLLPMFFLLVKLAIKTLQQ